MKITYLYHSCFYVELEQHILLFDYYKGELPTFHPKKKVFVFVSHRHHDHYNQKIFKIKHPDVTYILSDDIHVTYDNTYFIQPHQSIVVDKLQVFALKSTDEGVAFLIELESKIIYHGGDLHWWDWGEEDSEEESKQMKEAYQSEIGFLENKHIDVAFIPVDPRLKENFYKGAFYFLTHVDAKIVFPMHFERNVAIITKLCEQKNCKPFQYKIQKIMYENQKFQF